MCVWWWGGEVGGPDLIIVHLESSGAAFWHPCKQGDLFISVPPLSALGSLHASPNRVYSQPPTSDLKIFLGKSGLRFPSLLL